MELRSGFGSLQDRQICGFGKDEMPAQRKSRSTRAIVKSTGNCLRVLDAARIN